MYEVSLEPVGDPDFSRKWPACWRGSIAQFRGPSQVPGMHILGRDAGGRIVGEPWCLEKRVHSGLWCICLEPHPKAYHVYPLFVARKYPILTRIFMAYPNLILKLDFCPLGIPGKFSCYFDCRLPKEAMLRGTPEANKRSFQGQKLQNFPKKITGKTHFCLIPDVFLGRILEKKIKKMTFPWENLFFSHFVFSFQTLSWKKSWKKKDNFKKMTCPWENLLFSHFFLILFSHSRRFPEKNPGKKTNFKKMTFPWENLFFSHFVFSF